MYAVQHFLISALKGLFIETAIGYIFDVQPPGITADTSFDFHRNFFTPSGICTQKLSNKIVLSFSVCGINISLIHHNIALWSTQPISCTSTTQPFRMGKSRSHLHFRSNFFMPYVMCTRKLSYARSVLSFLVRGINISLIQCNIIILSNTVDGFCTYHVQVHASLVYIENQSVVKFILVPLFLHKIVEWWYLPFQVSC